MTRNYNAVFSPGGGFMAHPGGDKPVFIPEEDAVKEGGYRGTITVPEGFIKPFDRAWDAFLVDWGLRKESKYRVKRGPEEIKRPGKELQIGHPAFDDPALRDRYATLGVYNALGRYGITVRELSPSDFLKLDFSRKSVGFSEVGRGRAYVRSDIDEEAKRAVASHEGGHAVGLTDETDAYRWGRDFLGRLGLYREKELLEELERTDPRFVSIN